MRRLTAIAVIAAAGLLAAACGGGSSSGGSSSSSASSVLTVDNEGGSLWTCNFNPFNLSDIGYSLGPVYEPLVFVNTLQNGKATPWLASAWTWSNSDKTLTFTIRNGVKWSDGKPMTAADVVYTFNLLKQNKALDLNSVWSVLSSVTQQGSDKVVMTFKTPAVSYFYYIADQVAIVPQHIWSKISDPVKYPDTSPVGTGAYTIGCTANNISYTANPHYWQPGEPKLKTVDYPAFTSNDTANTYLANGQAQWGSQFIPSIGKFYLSKSPDNHYWFPPVANVSLFINLKNPILANVAVRQAMAYAIDRKQASVIGEYGYEPPSNQTGIVTPTFASWLDSGQAAPYGSDYAYNPAKARQILTAAGFKMVNGVMTKGSQQLSFSIINNGGFSDWVAAVNVIAGDLKAVGIQVTPKNLAAPAYQAALYNGNYQLGYGSETGGPTPYYELRQWLFSGNTAPVGQPAGSNFERYRNPSTDALINSYGSTTSPAQQHTIVAKLQAVMLKDVPVIPVTEQVDWYQYNTSNFTGWVTQGNPYAQPAAYNYPDWGQMLLHLAPSK
ncbi:MAG: ABC transporter substrate-binding protein [Streptosporangiaceae bacterium]